MTVLSVEAQMRFYSAIEERTIIFVRTVSTADLDHFVILVDEGSCLRVDCRDFF